MEADPRDVVASGVEVEVVRSLLDNRYDDLKSGRVEPIDGEQFFELLRQRGEKRAEFKP